MKVLPFLCFSLVLLFQFVRSQGDELPLFCFVFFCLLEFKVFFFFSLFVCRVEGRRYFPIFTFIFFHVCFSSLFYLCFFGLFTMRHGPKWTIPSFSIDFCLLLFFFFFHKLVFFFFTFFILYIYIYIVSFFPLYFYC